MNAFRTASDELPAGGAGTEPSWTVGSRHLDPSYFEVVPLPRELVRFSSCPDTLPPGYPGKVAVLDLTFGHTAGGRTQLRHHYQKSPLQITRPLHFDPGFPELAIVFVMSVGAGLVQGDRFRIDVVCEEGSALHLTTQSATKVLEMDDNYATSAVNITAGPASFVEYLPGAIIPHARSRSYHRTRLIAADDATAIVSETIRAGRTAYGEHHDYDVLATDLEIVRPDGEPLVTDRIRLSADAGIAGPAVLGDTAQIASLYVVSGVAAAAGIAEGMCRALATMADLRWGVSTLPGGCGAWVRILGSHSPSVDRAVHNAWDAARRVVAGVPAPNLRKSATFSP